jgi:hypothetical protein
VARDGGRPEGEGPGRKGPGAPEAASAKSGGGRLRAQAVAPRGGGGRGDGGWLRAQVAATAVCGHLACAGISK